MIVPSKAALLALSYLCFDQVACTSNSEKYQQILKNPVEKAKYRAACPAYEHYAKQLQYATLHI